MLDLTAFTPTEAERRLYKGIIRRRFWKHHRPEMAVLFGLAFLAGFGVAWLVRG